MSYEKRLHKLLDDIFEDSVVDRKEHDALAAMTRNAEVDRDVVRKVFVSFVEKKWGEAMADGVLTPQERLLLLGMLRELRLPDEAIPHHLRCALLID